jgi:hypothetical protein
MPVQAEELGVKTSKPIEIYDFVAGTTTYRYTSYRKDVVFDGNTYTAIPLERGALGIVPQGQGGELAVTVDIELDVVQNHVKVPPLLFNAVVRRLQNGVAWQMARGPVSPWILKGQKATARIGTLASDPIKTQIPSYALSPRCQHVLYEGLCQSLRTDHDFVTSVVSVSADGLTVVVTSVNTNPDGWYSDGEFWVGGIPSFIVKQVGTTLTLLEPLPGLSPSDACTLYDGCDRAPTTCRDKHNQMQRYGGHPYFKSKNPFINRLAWDE